MTLDKLREPFPEKDIEWRVGQAGAGAKGPWAKVLAYITNRAIMERLDQVCGPENWKNEFRGSGERGVLCGLSIRCGEEWVTKWDGAEETEVEAVKGGLSGAMKRAGVQWGIGRYLYDLEEGWANIHPGGQYYQAGKLGKYDSFRWDPPPLPGWALPAGASPRPAQAPRAAPPEPAPARAPAAPAPEQGPGGEYPKDTPYGRLHFSMQSVPAFRNGNGVLAKTNKGVWSGWTWDQLVKKHMEHLLADDANEWTSPLINIAGNDFLRDKAAWVQEQAQTLLKMAAVRARYPAAPAEPEAEPENVPDYPPDDDFDLNNVPF